MRILRYLPMLIVAFAVTAAAEDGGSGSSGAKTQMEIDQILARPEIRLDDLFRIATKGAIGQFQHVRACQ